MIQQSSFYTRDELSQLGLKAYGENVLISRFARLYSPHLMEIGNHVRIDDFCVLSGTIKLGTYIHISAYCALYGKFGIEIDAFSGLSPRCTVFSATDDFSGEYLIGPMVDEKFTGVKGGKVIFKKYVQLGAGCIVLPDVVLNEGATAGAMSLINRSLDEWIIYKGIPSRKHAERKKNVLECEKQFLLSVENSTK